MITPSISDSISTVMPPVPVTVATQGRVRTSREQRRVLLAEFERSGMSAARFAQRTGLKYSTLAGWVQRYRRTKRPGRKTPVRLLEAVVAPTPCGPAVTVQWPGGARLEICAASQVPLAAALMHALTQPC